MTDPDTDCYICKICGCKYFVTRYSLHTDRTYCARCLNDLRDAADDAKFQERRERETQ